MVPFRIAIAVAAGLVVAGFFFLDFRSGDERIVEENLLTGRTTQMLEEARDTLAKSPGDGAAHGKRILATLALPTSDAPALAVAAMREMEAAGVKDNVLQRAMNYPIARVRRNAAQTIGLLKLRHARTALEQRVQDPAAEVRVAVVEALGRLCEPQSFFSLALALRDGEWQVRAEAAAALGRLGELAAVAHLLHTVGDPDGYVRYQTRHALLALAGQGRSEMFRAHLRNVSETQAEIPIQLALAKCGDPQAFGRVAALFEGCPAEDRADVLKTLAEIDAVRARALFERLIPKERDEQALAFMEMHRKRERPRVE